MSTLFVKPIQFEIKDGIDLRPRNTRSAPRQDTSCCVAQGTSSLLIAGQNLHAQPQLEASRSEQRGPWGVTFNEISEHIRTGRAVAGWGSVCAGSDFCCWGTRCIRVLCELIAVCVLRTYFLIQQVKRPAAEVSLSPSYLSAVLLMGDSPISGSVITSTALLLRAKGAVEAGSISAGGMERR